MYKSDYLTLDGKNLNRAARVSDFRVMIGKCMSSTIEGPADHLDTIFYVDGIKTAGFTLLIEVIIKPLAKKRKMPC